MKIWNLCRVSILVQKLSENEFKLQGFQTQQNSKLVPEKIFSSSILSYEFNDSSGLTMKSKFFKKNVLLKISSVSTE